MQIEADQRAAIDDEAAVWFARKTSGRWTPADQHEFDEWFSQSPAHAAAYRTAETVWETIGGDEELASLAVERERALSASPSPPRSLLSALLGAFRWRPGWAVAGAAAASAALMLAWPLQQGYTDYSTQTAEIEEVRLPDGSRIDLAPDSRIRVAFSAKRRSVELRRGEAFFDVAKDEARAFTVRAADTEVIVTGTAFNVHRSPNAVTVAVAEGAVKVRIPSIDGASGANPLRGLATGDERSRHAGGKKGPAIAAALRAGQQVVAHAGEGLRPVAELSPDMAGAWRSGHLVYMDNRLGDVVADINRYSETPIVLESDVVADMRIAVALPTTAIRTMLNMVDSAVPVLVDYDCAGRIVIRHRDSVEQCAPA